jgi:hypothetical protein
MRVSLAIALIAIVLCSTAGAGIAWGLWLKSPGSAAHQKLG